MANPLDDERIQFFLRHREDIKAWAAIESEVTAAVREMLGALQPEIEERLQAIDGDVSVARRDNKNWERIQAYRETWPDWCGVTLEWQTNVDPFGSVLPKIGMFIVGEPDAVDPGRQAFLAGCDAEGQLQQHGFRLGANNVWPVLGRVEKSRDWWRDPEAWTGSMVESVVGLWMLTAPLMDRAFGTDEGRP